MSRYKKHIFICVNERKNQPFKKSCGNLGMQIRNKFLEELKKHKINIIVRANKSGCLSACATGPTVVIYPEGIWYKKVSLKDVPIIVEKTIINNEIINSLLLN